MNQMHSGLGGPTLASEDGGPIKGQVSGLQQRFERSGEVVWNFRVERQDASGNPLPRVAVEMRGLGFEGALNNGDWVEVTGKFNHGTLMAAEVSNLSTRATVRARGMGGGAKALGAVIGGVVVVIFVVVAIGLLSSGGGGQSDGDSERRQRQTQQQFEQERRRSEREFERRATENRERALREFCANAPTHPSCD